jgi:hypothetical protein
MTATLAAELADTAAHMEAVRSEYAHTKADHAHEDGCGVCPTPFVEGRSIGWEYEPDGTPLLCPPCVAEAKRWIAQEGTTPPREKCANGHDLTVAANVYREPGRPHLITCAVCRLGRARRRNARIKAERAAAKAGA